MIAIDRIKVIVTMIADLNNVPEIYWYCRKKFFNNELPDPKFCIIHSKIVLAKFNCRKAKKTDQKKGKKWKPLAYKCISISDCFDFDRETLINIMAHEMIHYYLAEHQIKDDKSHGKEFMRMAQELNEKYGLNITETLDASEMEVKSPKINGAGFVGMRWLSGRK